MLNFSFLVVIEPSSPTLEIKQMDASISLIGNNMEFLDFCKEYLLNENKDFTVIGIIGAQATGKSTILSMLAKNDSMDMYR